MKIYILITAIFSTFVSNAQLKIPSQSPSADIKQNIGLTEVEITYSRPSARERIIFGENGLLPFGEFWRVGANAATKISLSKDLIIADQVLKGGSYTVLSKPGAKTWELNWYTYKDADWNSYVDKEPILRQKLPVHNSNTFTETMEFRFQDVTMDSAVLLLEWENTGLRIPLSVNEKEVIFKGIDRALAGPSSFDYYQAALYLHETQTDLRKALQYIQKVTASDDALFFQVTREALILRDLKRNKEAIAIANRALVLSKEAGNTDFIRLNEKIIEELGF